MRRSKRFGIPDVGLLIIAAISVATFAACTPDNKPATTPPVSSPSPVASPSASPTGSPAAGDKKVSKVDAWAGKWTGVEGTYLNLTKKGDKYTVEIANLDGPKTYEGTAKGDTIEFTRNGKTETIKAATGAETGMKYLEKETNCLVVTKGSEGFCRKQ
jgi:hypothetical protein